MTQQIWILIFTISSNSLETKLAKANSGEKQYPLTSTLIASKLQSGNY